MPQLVTWTPQLVTWIALATLMLAGCWLAWLPTRRTYRARALALESLRDALRADLQRARDERDRLFWHVWWVRNAVETPAHDPARAHYLRWALASHLAPDLPTLHRDLIAIAGDLSRSEHERIHAKAFASELETERKPWEQWTESTGRPLHNAERIAHCYRAALSSWPALFEHAEAA